MTVRQVSVLMPARNAATTIAQSLRSVLDAPETGEVIVVEDGSTDRTADVLRSLPDPRIRVIEGPRAGISAALNAGIAAATLPFIARCDSDDLFAPGRLARQCGWLSGHPEFVAVSGGFSSIDAQGGHLADLACEGLAREVTQDLRAGHVITHLCGWLIRREALQATGGARPWFETAEDIDLQFRLACAGRVWHDPVPAYLYRLHGGSITHGRSADRLAFFDRAAAEFLRERLATGTDALDRGAPPAVPDFGTGTAAPAALTAQVTGHMTAQAWRDFAAGRRGAALWRMAGALRRDPLNTAHWRGLAAMALKTLRPGG